MLKQLVKLAAMTAVCGFLQYLVFQAADIARGYQATGSEIMVFPALMIAGYYLLGFARYDREQEKEHERRKHRQGNARTGRQGKKRS